MKSTIKVNNIWIEDLFEWFYQSVLNHGGDGAAYIVCENYVEASNLFAEWWKANKLGFEILEKCVDKNHNVSFYDDQECWIFTCDKDLNTSAFDYMFVIESECVSANEKNKLYGVKNES